MTIKVKIMKMSGTYYFLDGTVTSSKSQCYPSLQTVIANMEGCAEQVKIFRMSHCKLDTM